MEKEAVDRESGQEGSDRGDEPGVEEGAAPMIAGTALVIDARERGIPVYAVSVTRLPEVYRNWTLLVLRKAVKNVSIPY